MKKALKIIGIVLVLLGVYYVTWTPSTDGISETAKKAVIASEERTCPNNDFRNVRHFPKEWKKDYTGTPGKYPQTCMNTVSSFFCPESNWAQCNWFVAHHKQLGFEETTHPKPGDIVVFFKKNNDARHTGLFVGYSLFGPLMNHSDGGKKPHNYQKHFPILLYVGAGRARGYIDYKYYTYSGSSGSRTKTNKKQ